MRLQTITVVIASLAKIQRETAAVMSFVRSCYPHMDRLRLNPAWNLDLARDAGGPLMPHGKPVGRTGLSRPSMSPGGGVCSATRRS